MLTRPLFFRYIELRSGRVLSLPLSLLLFLVSPPLPAFKRTYTSSRCWRYTCILTICAAVAAVVVIEATMRVSDGEGVTVTVVAATCASAAAARTRSSTLPRRTRERWRARQSLSTRAAFRLTCLRASSTPTPGPTSSWRGARTWRVKCGGSTSSTNSFARSIRNT